ncbi:MAG: nucleotidyltransferase [Nitrospira sp.]|nr:nucleotidyltransferase [Nitrospira sp.]
MAPKTTSRSPHTDTVDTLLADIAIRVQLNRTDYTKAVSRYQTINDWIEREGSPLNGHITLFYPQGSMAIGTTIASKLKTDEFDIDVVAQLDPALKVLSPRDNLDLLYEAIRGKPGSQYHQMTQRRTRCVTVNYSDNMHLDVTPTLRMPNTPERESCIFHHKPGVSQEQGGQFIIANPYGFAEWFKRKTPPETDFADFFEKRAKEYERHAILAEADSDPVPPQEQPLEKSKAVIVLQLMKRWRNVQYDMRTGRRPPSIMIAKLVADAANHTDSLSEQLLSQAESMLSIFRQSHDQGRRVHIVNPVCAADVLTDRWPGSSDDQKQFIRDLEVFVQRVKRLVAGTDLEEMKKIMVELFGEVPAKESFKAFNERTGDTIASGRSQYDPYKGGLIIPGSLAVAGITAPSITRATPKHTFYGTERRKQ